MCYLIHRFRIFLFCSKVMFCYPDTQVFIFLAIPWFTKSVTWWVLVHKTHFWIYLMKHNSLSHQTWPTERYYQGQYFLGFFRTIWRTGAKFQVLFNLATCSSYSITNYVNIPVFHFFGKVNKAQLKMVNVEYQKWPDLAMLSF